MQIPAYLSEFLSCSVLHCQVFLSSCQAIEGIELRPDIEAMPCIDFPMCSYSASLMLYPPPLIRIHSSDKL